MSDQGFAQLVEAAFWPGNHGSVKITLQRAVFVLHLCGPLLTACSSVPLRLGSLNVLTSPTYCLEAVTKVTLCSLE